MMPSDPPSSPTPLDAPPLGQSTPVWITAENPAEHASKLLSHALTQAIERRGHARFAIPGGSALGVVEAVRARLGPHWQQVRLTWIDERCVPVADEDSNRGEAARRGLVSAGPFPAASPDVESSLPLFVDSETPTEAIRRVERELDQHYEGALDVVLLGLGEDGHIASLFPTRELPGVGRVAHVADSPKPPAARMTLTLDMIATAQTQIVVATGEGKRAALDAVYARDVQLPTSRLDAFTIVTDLEAPTAPTSS